jgi:CHAT domain-containing protein
LGQLPYGEKEAALAAAASPGSTALLHEAATKKSVEDNWERANFIYIAAHFIRSLDTPYLSFLPLAGPEDSPPDASLLEYSEIRKADLSGCKLVILSGCATGAEYMNVQATGPSLGDAFIDAGARAVVHTRWRVEDKESYELANNFIQHWASGESPITALNNAERAAWRRSGGEPSSTWTSYAIALSEIPQISRPKAQASRNK